MRARRWSSSRGAAGILLAVLLGCSAGDGDAPAAMTTTATTPVTAEGLVGPLCPMLPAGDEPGNPTSLRDLAPGEALTWIPVATVFEASVRAAAVDLAGPDGLTLLVPSDDTFKAALSEGTLDDLLVHRTGELRTLVEAHIVEGAMSLEELARRGRVTTRAGTEIAVTGTAGALLFDGAGGVLCGDYRAGAARIHVIDAVLGDLPEAAAGDEDAH